MNEQSITISWDNNADGYSDILVVGNVDGRTHFRETFLSLDRIPPIYDISEKETSSNNTERSATIALLSPIIARMQMADKTSGQLISEQEYDLRFSFTDLVTIRKFAEIAGIRFDERKFRSRREFRMYVQSLMKEDKRN